MAPASGQYVVRRGTTGARMPLPRIRIDRSSPIPLYFQVSAQLHRRVELTSLFDDLDAAGQHPTTEVLALDPTRVNATAAATIGVDPATPIVYVERLRLADGRPRALMHNWLPPEYA